MQQQIPLKRFEYCLARFTSLDIDFEKGSLRLYTKGMKVKASIYTGFGVNLSDPADQALVFSLNGILEKDKTINACTGLLVIKNATEMKGRSGTEWDLTIYLYDDFAGDREIKFNLWMLPLSENATLN
jgi:hypothetical protein